MRRVLITWGIYLIFFLSGAAALMYEVVWVRSLSLVFGGTHLAVATVLSVFMGGLALGGYIIGSRFDAGQKPLRLYGYLEIGIALSALAFIALMKIYPVAYVALAQGMDDHRLYLTLIRILLAFLVMIIPTTLMGGTLPVLTQFFSRHTSKIGVQLSFLYGFNTLGAVAGTATAGFILLRYYSVSTALYSAIVINFLIGLVAVLLQDRALAVFEPAAQLVTLPEDSRDKTVRSRTPEKTEPENLFSLKLILFGIGISGFCALGYEVLWTRILTLTIGTSVYGFTIMLIAFLIGISLGSKAYVLIVNLFPSIYMGKRNQILFFGIVQFIIGATALFVTVNIPDLPSRSLLLRDFYSHWGLSAFDARQWANMTLALSYMAIPTFFMGLAFPLAGSVTEDYTKTAGHAVGRVLAHNTVGAILGSAVSGFILIYAFGIERSLQMLTIINMGFGLFVLFSLKKNKLVNGAIGGLTLALLMFLALNQTAFKIWDAKFFAIYQNNAPQIYDTPEKRQEAIENTDVLFYHEGINSTISAIQPKGANKAVLVNGKVVASSALKDQQCQLTLGHLPMLLHKDPRKVLVVGLGTGMTLGAVSVHPGVEDLTLAEIEPHVLGAAKIFGQYNHQVLDDPKLKIVFNDGRNFLLTTKNKYDVITADPIHPWTQGSAYLYTKEYFKIASEHLLPGGIMCQWLPLYELSVSDLKSIARTFSLHFKYTMTWLTQYDAEIVGSNEPLVIDEARLEQRMAFPAISKDLSRVAMGTAVDFLSYFLMGTDGMTAFGKGGVINTDDNVYLEFSTPQFVGVNTMYTNVSTLARYRESILPFLLPAPAGMPRKEQERRWTVNGEASTIADRAHALFVGGHYDVPEFQHLMVELDKKYPAFAPGRFIKREYLLELSRVPTLLQKTPFVLLNERGEKVDVEISAVIVRISEKRAALIFVDNAAKEIYGQLYFSAPDLDQKMKIFARKIITALHAAYNEQADISRSQGQEFPAEGPTMIKMQEIIASNVKAYN